MSKSLFVPSEVDTNIELNFADQPSVTVDMFDLEDVFVKASELAKEMGVNWKSQAPKQFKKRLNIEVTQTQAVLIYGAVQAHIMDAKKKLLLESKDSTKQDA